MTWHSFIKGPFEYFIVESEAGIAILNVGLN